MTQRFENWAEHLISFYRDLSPSGNLPDEIEWLHPQKDPIAFSIVEQFFHKFYHDSQPRTLMLGINPGRFGAGVTGVNFTAPKQLTQYCGIPHPFRQGTELSAEFIYEMIEAYGGAAKFYKHFFIGSVCPLGFVQYGKNLNYYDHKALAKEVEGFVIAQLERLLLAPVNRDVCFCIGGEKNFKYLSKLNAERQWFRSIVPLPHPRFIMQYKRKEKEQFILQYLQSITKE